MKMIQEAIAGRPPGKVYELTIMNLFDKYPKFSGRDTPVILLVSPRRQSGKSLMERFSSTTGLKTTYDRILYKLWKDVEENGRSDLAPFLPAVFLLSSDMKLWARLDMTDSRTNTLPKIAAAIDKIENSFAGTRGSHDSVEADAASEAVESASRKIGVEPSQSERIRRGYIGENAGHCRKGCRKGRS